MLSMLWLESKRVDIFFKFNYTFNYCHDLVSFGGQRNMFRGLVAVVTGGASGLGRATAERLAGEEARVILCDLPTSKGHEVANQIGSNVFFEPLDVTSLNNIKKLAANVHHSFKKVDVLVNCAGISLLARTYDDVAKKPHSMEDFVKVMEVNALGTFNVIRHVSALMHFNKRDDDGGKGVIINTAGISAFDGKVGEVACAASHGALASMTLPLARDLSQEGIRVVCIAPGLFDTPMTQALPEQVIGYAKSRLLHPKRLGQPSEFASLVEHIIQNRMLNAEVIRLDAGLRQL